MVLAVPAAFKVSAAVEPAAFILAVPSEILISELLLVLPEAELLLN
jgi:hypothetical protein